MVVVRLAAPSLLMYVEEGYGQNQIEQKHQGQDDVCSFKLNKSLPLQTKYVHFKRRNKAKPSGGKKETDRYIRRSDNAKHTSRVGESTGSCPHGSDPGATGEPRDLLKSTMKQVFKRANLQKTAEENSSEVQKQSMSTGSDSHINQSMNPQIICILLDPQRTQMMRESWKMFRFIDLSGNELTQLFTDHTGAIR